MRDLRLYILILVQECFVGQTALQLDPQHANTRLNLGLLYHKTGHREQALAELARVAQFPGLTPEQRERSAGLDKRIREGAPAPGSGD